MYASNRHQKCLTCYGLWMLNFTCEMWFLRQHGKLELCFLVVRGCDLLIKEIMFYLQKEEGEKDGVHVNVF